MTPYQHRWLDGGAIELNCSKVVCVGKNYADHIKEMNSATPQQPVLFIKPGSALCDATQALKLRHLQHLGELHHELEIALLIGKELSGVVTDVSGAIAGIGLGIDLTLRDLQHQLKTQGLPWERSKSFDNSCALSAFIQHQEGFDLTDIDLELILNGKTQQKSNSSLMLTPISELLTEIATVFTLLPGDVVLTGTPAGVSALRTGDSLSARLNDQLLIKNTKVI